MSVGLSVVASVDEAPVKSGEWEAPVKSALNAPPPVVRVQMRYVRVHRSVPQIPVLVDTFADTDEAQSFMNGWRRFSNRVIANTDSDAPHGYFFFHIPNSDPYHAPDAVNISDSHAAVTLMPSTSKSYPGLSNPDGETDFPLGLDFNFGANIFIDPQQDATWSVFPPDYPFFTARSETHCALSVTGTWDEYASDGTTFVGTHTHTTVTDETLSGEWNFGTEFSTMKAVVDAFDFSTTTGAWSTLGQSWEYQYNQYGEIGGQAYYVKPGVHQPELITPHSHWSGVTPVDVTTITPLSFGALALDGVLYPSTDNDVTVAGAVPFSPSSPLNPVGSSSIRCFLTVAGMEMTRTQIKVLYPGAYYEIAEMIAGTVGGVGQLLIRKISSGVASLNQIIDIPVPSVYASMPRITSAGALGPMAINQMGTYLFLDRTVEDYMISVGGVGQIITAW